jgi:hypothetical protein
MWSRRRAVEAPLPRAAEGRRTRGIHQAAADEAPLSNAGAFFSAQHVPLVAGPEFLNRFRLIFCRVGTYLYCRRQDFLVRE